MHEALKLMTRITQQKQNKKKEKSLLQIYTCNLANDFWFFFVHVSSSAMILLLQPKSRLIPFMFIESHNTIEAYNSPNETYNCITSKDLGPNSILF